MTAIDGRAASAQLVARQRLFWRPDDDEGLDYWVAGGRLWYVGRARAFLRGLPRETSADGRPGPLRNGLLVAVDATHLRLADDRGSVDAVRP